MRLSLLLAVLVLAAAVPASAQDWQFANVFPPDTLETDGNGMHGIAVDPEGKVWMQTFGATDSVAVAELGGDFFPVRVISVFNADGTPASFSPVRFVDYADGTTPRDTLGGFVTRNAANELIWEGRSGRGLRADSDGNILVSQFTTLFKLDYETGQGLARVDVPETLTQAGVDNMGNVYLAPVVPGTPIRIYDTDLNFLGNVSEASSNFSRSITASPDGLTVYETAFENTFTIIHQRADIFSEFDSVGVAFRGMRTESAAFNPATGNLWVSSGNPLNLPNQDATVETSWLSNTWYEFSPDDLETPLDSIRWAGCENYIAGVCQDTPARPRGIAFTTDGTVAYVAAFSADDISPGSNAEKFIRMGVAVEPTGTAVPEQVALGQNYPNPFRGSTQIDFDLPETGHAALRVYDVRGREVAVLVDEVLSARSYSAQFNAEGLASGVYVYVLSLDGRQLSTNRMMLIE
ncbi:MAG: T9SS type A sorting domain-containing protein [Rhodothermales bacterium]